MRTDARRNRARILASARELFAQAGNDAQMDQIAQHAGLGMGTLYRHFPNKQALLGAIISERFRAMSDVALAAETIEDPGVAFERVLRGFLEAAEGDTAFQWAMLGSQFQEWENVEEDKAALAEIITRIIDRAVSASRIRADITFADFPVISGGVLATMFFKPSPDADWRRHLDLVLGGIRI